MKRTDVRWGCGLLVAGLLLALVVPGCGPREDSGSKETINLVYVNWADAIALTNLARAVLEDSLNCRVTVMMADVAPVFTSVAQGDKDAFLDVWLPVTHADYIKKYGKDLVDLGPNFRGARIGLVVPAYVRINSIGELNGAKDRFGGEIIGIDSGAGIMRTTERAIKAYGLDYKLLPSSGPAMTAALKGAVQDSEWIVVTGWKPHWMFARWDLKFLKDPKEVYGAVENLHTYVRKGFEKDHPNAAAFFRKLELNGQQLGSLMGRIADSGGDPLAASRDWIRDNGPLVSSWLQK